MVSSDQVVQDEWKEVFSWAKWEIGCALESEACFPSSLPSFLFLFFPSFQDKYLLSFIFCSLFIMKYNSDT